MEKLEEFILEKDILGHMLLKQGLLLSKRLGVSRLLWKATKVKRAFGGGHPSGGQKEIPAN